MKTTQKLLAAARVAAVKAFPPGSENHRRVMAGLASAESILGVDAVPTSDPAPTRNVARDL